MQVCHYTHNLDVLDAIDARSALLKETPVCAEGGSRGKASTSCREVVCRMVIAYRGLRFRYAVDDDGVVLLRSSTDCPCVVRDGYAASRNTGE